MKLRFIFSIMLLFFTQVIIAQTVKIKVENNLKTAIANATVLSGNEIIATTNEKGEATLNATQILDNSVVISAPNYNETYFLFGSINDINEYIIVLENQSTNLDEIVVTVGRKPEHITTVPSSITILNEEDIALQSAISNNLSSILGNLVPGLGTTTNKATNAGQTLRGRQVLVLIDGVPQSTPLMNGQRDIRTIDAQAIERVEVIKGATSIYGNGSGGGIINYITKKNTKTNSFHGTSIVGTNFNPIHGSGTLGYRASQYFNGRKNKFSYVAGASYAYTGLQRDAKGEPLGQTDGLSNTNQINGFTKLGYDFTDHSSLTMLYNYYGSTQKAKYISKTGVYGQTPTIGIKGTEPGENAGTPYNHNFMLTFTKDNLFNTTKLDVTAYVNSFRSMNRYVANSSAWYGAGQTKINSNKKGLRINFNTPINTKFPIDLTYGLDVLNDVTYQDLVDGRVYIPKMDMANIAPYAQIRMDFFDHLIFKGGVRYENATVNVKDYQTIATGPNNEGSIFVQGGKIPYEATMFNAGLRYKKYGYFNPFVSFSQGFAINELGRILRKATENTIENLATDPIITNNYEAGFSSRFSKFNISAAYFISTSKLGVNLVDVGGYLTPQREPERVYGYEFTVDYFATDKLSFGGNYSFVEGKATFDDGSKVYLNGSRIAPVKAVAYVNYSPINNLNLQLSWLHTDARNRFEKNEKGKYNNSEGPINAVQTVNFSSSYSFKTNWTVSLGIENLLNNYYYPTVSQYRALDADYVLGNGMNASLNLQYKF